MHNLITSYTCAGICHKVSIPLFSTEPTEAGYFSPGFLNLSGLCTAIPCSLISGYLLVKHISNAYFKKTCCEKGQLIELSTLTTRRYGITIGGLFIANVASTILFGMQLGINSDSLNGIYDRCRALYPER